MKQFISNFTSDYIDLENTDISSSLNKSGKKNQNPQNIFDYETLSDLLHYESFDERHEIFINKKGHGFLLEVGLFIGSNEALERELDGLFQAILPENSSIQFLLVASPKVGDILNNWQEIREQKSHYELLVELAKKRVDFFKNLAYNNKARDFRLYISYSINEKPEEFNLRQANILRNQIETVIKTTGNIAKVCYPEDLINLLSEILNYSQDIDKINAGWNKYQFLNDQIIDKSSLFELTNKALIKNDGEFEYRTYSVRKYPTNWSLGAMSQMIGDNFRELLFINSFFIIHYGVYIDGSKIRQTKLLAKGARVESQAASPLGKWIPALAKEAAEWNFVRESFEQNERLIKTNYQVLLIDKPGNIDRSEQVLLTLYRSNSWHLMLDRFITLPSFLSIMPMSWGSGMEQDMSYFRKNRTTLSYEAVNLLPVQGEYKGTPTPGVLLAGRKGQLFYWYPFDNKSGNFNTIVAGRSGSGKSVFMQELASTVLSLGGKVYVVDIGKSFERQAKFLGGQFVGFNTGSQICINPFSSIDDQNAENSSDSLSLLKPIISLMVAPKAGTTDYEDAIIEKALVEVWEKLGKKATIDDFSKILLADSDEIAKRLGKMLFPYTKRGSYGKFFNGESNVNLDDKFIVVELQDLKGKPDLQAVVFQIFIVLITNKILLGDWTVPSAIEFDEAWDGLSGKQGSKFMEALVRTLRKCFGMLIMGTQGVNDFYSSPSAEAAFNNSDWLCMLSQKKESIELLKKSGKFLIDDYTQKMLSSVKTKQGEYSEVMIMHEHGSVIGQFRLDPFSRVLYTTKAEERNAVIKLQEEGYAIGDAITKVAEDLYGISE